jgi:hypothetical protein
MNTDRNRGDLHESSYFNFLMRNRSRRHAAIPFELVAGAPGRVCDVRVGSGSVNAAVNGSRPCGEINFTLN